MTEINAAYEVLRDPLRRAAYDRDLIEQDADAEPDEGWDDEREDDAWEHAGAAEGMLGCRQHGHAVAVGTCVDCGAGLCDGCFDRFRPPSCGPCILAWAHRRRRELWLHGDQPRLVALCPATLAPTPHVDESITAPFLEVRHP
jgi:hypothetical protein